MSESNPESEVPLIFERITSSLEKISKELIGLFQDELDKKDQKINELETLLKEKEKEILNLKSENDELYADLIKMESKNTLLSPEEKVINSKTQIKNEEKKEVKSAVITRTLNSGNDAWIVSEKLLENNEFSLKAFLDSNARKSKILKSFKKLIFMAVYDRYENNDDEVVNFLDLNESDREQSIETKAYSEWMESMEINTSFPDLFDELEKIPQKDRYKSLIEKFKKLIL